MQVVGSLPGVQRRASEAKVCTSAARKMRVPLAGARDGVHQEAWLPCWSALARRRDCSSGCCGVSPLRWGATETAPVLFAGAGWKLGEGHGAFLDLSF